MIENSEWVREREEKSQKKKKWNKFINMCHHGSGKRNDEEKGDDDNKDIEREMWTWWKK